MPDPVFIIAEAGVNHNGNLDLARRLIDVAAESGASAVKFQTFRASEVTTRSAPKAGYQIENERVVESQLEMLRTLELSAPDHVQLIEHSRGRNIEFLSTPFDLPSLSLLTGFLGLETIKVPSGEITNAPFLLAVARCARQVIMSTGMSTLDEVEAALGILAFGFVFPADAVPDKDNVAAAFASNEGRRALKDRVTVLHCTSEYPAPFSEVNLRAMDTMRERFGLRVGYSDHTRGVHIALAAVSRGATLIEKHFTLDRTLPGPDHTSSLEPSELALLVSAIRDIESALGDGVKLPSQGEVENRSVIRRSLVAARAIRRGERFSEENIVCKRPGTGVSPFAYWDFLGRTAARDYQPDEIIDD